MMIQPHQYHLIVNHLPVVGFVFTFLLLSIGILGRSINLERAACVLIIIVGISALAPYLTGSLAAEGVHDLLDVSHIIIEDHEESAALSLAMSLSTSAVAVAVLFFRTRTGTFNISLSLIVLALNVLTLFSLAYTANLGAQIRRPELRPQDVIP